MEEVELYQPKTLDYDFVIEEFQSEYKLDVGRLKEIYKEYLTNPTEELKREWFHLYPEFNEVYGNIEIEDFDISKLDLSDRAFKSVYFLQSDKDKFTNPIQHHSLQEVMLSDLQNERNRNKKLMGEAIKNHDKEGEKRFNSMQLALKVNMNSTYGASNNFVFPHYDPDIAGAITWASRMCIKQLTEGLACTEVYVDDEFKNSEDVQKYLADLSEIKDLIKFERLPEDQYDSIPRRRSLRRLFTDTYDVDHSKIIWKMIKKPCEIVYQDTDSNYFECHAIQKYYLGAALNSKNPDENDPSKFKCSPELLYMMMKKMVSLDNLLCKLVVLIIDRKPIGLGFEGSFVVCRYLNRKKKYYGVKAADDDGNVYTYLLDPEAYDEDGKLKPNYDDYWKPKNKCIPQSNGEFIVIDDSKILQTDTNYLDYIQSMGVKVTGIPLKRRDTYRFINYCHLKVLQKDLRICKYNTEKLDWEGISLKQSISNVVNEVIEDFKVCFNQFVKIANFQSDQTPSTNFNIFDFTKNNRHNNKKNPAGKIIQKYNTRISEINEEIATLNPETDEEKIEKLNKEKITLQSYIPEMGYRLFYVIMENDLTERQTLKGIKTTVKNKDAAVSLAEMGNILKYDKGFDEKYFEEHVGQLKLDYETWFNAKCISSLYLKHYLSSLAKGLSTYLFGERFPDIAADIDSGMYTDKDKAAIVEKYQEQIAQEIVDKYFPTAKAKLQNITKIKSFPTKISKTSNIEDEISVIVQKLYGSNALDYSKKDLLTITIKKSRYYEVLMEHLTTIMSRLIVDKFSTTYIFNNSNTNKLYQKLRCFIEKDETFLDKQFKQTQEKYILTKKLKSLIENCM